MPYGNGYGGGYGGGGSFGSGSSNSGNPFANGSNSFQAYFRTIQKYLIAHGVIMGVTVVLLFPLGSIFIRLGGNIWIHAFIQLFSFVCLIAGLATGVKLADRTHLLFNNTHTLLGISVIALFFLQPLFGIAHHILYKRHHSRTAISHVHIWYGRILIALAIINGGLGLELARNSKGGEIAYGVVAGVVFMIYLLAVVLNRKGRKVEKIVVVERRVSGRRGARRERRGSRREMSHVSSSLSSL
ncbi:hypothetical protein BGZ60DRAFT_417491 [Tricladium varicosporioides]|nr:hypothetical protein BGZ60DRAFT_417491 [Hymenoscyphus varicosporioides]